MKTSNKERLEKAKATLIEECARRGFVLLGDYVNAKTKIDMLCPNGHGVSIAPSNFKKGRGCSVCSKKGFEYGREAFIDAATNKGFVVTGGYSGANSQVEVICPNGHKTTINPQSIKKGLLSCRVCSKNDPDSAEKSLIEMVESLGFELISGYRGANRDVLMRCVSGHDFLMTPKNFKAGQRCPVCKGKNRKFAYLHKVEVGGFECIKFGVATNHPLRLVHQRLKNKTLSISVLGVWEFSNPDSCKRTEVEIKRSVKCGVLGKEQMPSGYTETCSSDSLQELIDIFESLGGVKCRSL